MTLRRTRLLPLACLLLLGTACSDSNIGTNNSPPEATIELPSVGSEVLEGSSVTFRGLVDDRGTPVDELEVTWASSIDGELLAEHPDAEGLTEFSTSELVAGTHTITLQVRDGMGASGQATVELAVRADAAPSISIVSPTTEGVYYSDFPVTLEATVEDLEDPPEALRISWTVEDDGEVLADDLVPDSAGVSSTPVDLTAGTWSLVATATDSVGNTRTDTVSFVVGPPNTAPTCAITAPDNLSSAPIGELVLLEGTVADVDVPADWLTVSFESNVDGPLGDATPSTAGEVGLATSALTAATHTLTMHVADEVGGTCSDFIFLTVSTPPEATITTPAAGDPLNSGDILTLTGTVSDAEDADDSLGVTWESDVDGLLSSPSPDSSGNVADNFGLSAGPHLLTLTATDSAGLTGTDTVSVAVNAGPTTPGVSIIPSAPTTLDDLVVGIDTPSTDPDGGPAALSYGYSWTRDGAPQAAWAGLDTVPASATTSGQLWEVTVTATDGQASSAGATASVTVGNSPPSITGVAISPTAGGEATVFSCVPSGWYDADGDAPGYSWLWTVDGNSSVTTQTIDGASFDAGQVLVCTATPNDGTVDGSALSSSPVTVANSPPSITGVTITPSTAYTDTTLTANPSGWVDADGDAPSYLYEWFADSTAVGGSSPTLGGAYFVKDETVTVTVTPQDASSSGTPVTSAGVVVLNTPPTAPGVSIAPSAPTDAEDLVCSVSSLSTDLDLDLLIYTYAWELNSSPTSYLSSTLPASATSAGETWTCVVTPSDGDDAGPSGSASVGPIQEFCAPGDGSDPSCPGTDCATILAAGHSTGDGLYWIDPLSSGSPYQVQCLMDTAYDGGGWTLVAVSSDDSQDTWTWNNRHYWDTDPTTFGSLAMLNEDFKSPALHEVSAADMLFVHAPSGDWAGYEGVSPSGDTFSGTVASIGGPNCYSPGTGFPLTSGTISGLPGLCETALYFSAMDQDFGGCGGDVLPEDSYGPVWSVTSSQPCPFDDPGNAGSLGPNIGFPSEEGEGGNPPSGYVNPVGFGFVAGLNTGLPGAAENYMQVYVRTVPTTPTDYSGLWSFTPTWSYSCVFGLIVVDLSTMTVTDNDPNITMDFGASLPGTMNGSFTSASEASVTSFFPGSCAENYSLEGTFTGPDTFVGSFTATYTPSSPGACLDCVGQYVPVVTAVR